MMHFELTLEMAHMRQAELRALRTSSFFPASAPSNQPVRRLVARMRASIGATRTGAEHRDPVITPQAGT